jgi:hypothetical protein
VGSGGIYICLGWRLTGQDAGLVLPGYSEHLEKEGRGKATYYSLFTNEACECCSWVDVDLSSRAAL